MQLHLLLCWKEVLWLVYLDLKVSYAIVVDLPNVAFAVSGILYDE